MQFLLILENFCINRKLNLKKVSFYKPPLTPFRPCPAKQQGKILSFQLRGKTNRQMLCIKGGQKGDKNWWKHVRARYIYTVTLGLTCSMRYSTPHLSKWPSDLKSNGTQENITFSGPVFHGLSCGVFLFVASVSFKNHHLNGLNFSTANQVLLFYGFWS